MDLQYMLTAELCYYKPLEKGFHAKGQEDVENKQG